MNVRDFTSNEKISKEYYTSLWYHYMYKGSSKIHWIEEKVLEHLRFTATLHSGTNMLEANGTEKWRRFQNIGGFTCKVEHKFIIKISDVFGGNAFSNDYFINGFFTFWDRTLSRKCICILWFYSLSERSLTSSMIGT